MRLPHHHPPLTYTSRPSQEVKKRNIKSNPKNNPINNPKNNPINNPKYNPINAARTKEKLRTEGDAYLRLHGQQVLSPYERWVALYEVEDNPEAFLRQDELELVGPHDPWLVGKSLTDLLNHPSGCIYFGETGRRLKDECFRWVGGRDVSMGGGGVSNAAVH